MQTLLEFSCCQQPRFNACLRRVILAVLIATGGCSSPAQKFDYTAASLGLERRVVTGTTFQHVVFWHRADVRRETLHVYLDGDGTPVRDGRATEDPTPRNTLMLNLLALDPGPAVYIGRPCYHGQMRARECSDDLWTTARYSDRVVSSLADTLKSIMAVGPYDGLAFFGHSGGGTLAMLLGERFPNTKAIITIAANLDIDAWADHHDIPRLSASLNPVARRPIQGVLQRHYVGSHDHIVPRAIVTRSISAANSELMVIEGYDHLCCWESLWPTILRDVTIIENMEIR